MGFLTIVYDPSIWTEQGYILQRFIGNAAWTGIKLFAIVFGISLVPEIIYWFVGLWRK